MRRTWPLALLALSQLGMTAQPTLTQVISASELDTSERGAFTSTGRFFVIGTRPDTGSWIVEITKHDDGSYAATNLVAGTLEGTVDGTLSGKPIGDACAFSGMTVHGDTLYAGCYSLAFDRRVSLFAVDTQSSSVRAGYFDSCNTQPASSPCTPAGLYPNGMSADAAGNLYMSNFLTHIAPTGDAIDISVEGKGSIIQAQLNPEQGTPGKLTFSYRTWFSTDIISDGISPNGIQIEGSVLYYAAGANINRIEIREDGSAGTTSVHYRGPLFSYIDDFAVHDGKLVLARTIPSALVALDRAPAFGLAPELWTKTLPDDAIPSSVTYQADIPTGSPLFPLGSFAVTCFFGGGLYILSN